MTHKFTYNSCQTIGTTFCTKGTKEFKNLHCDFSMKSSRYRSANIIIQTILEGIIRAEREDSFLKQGIVKSHLIRYSGLKTTTAEKYLTKLENAGYIEKREEAWGERTIIIFTITALGKERHEWFVKINSEIEEEKEENDK